MLSSLLVPEYKKARWLLGAFGLDATIMRDDDCVTAASLYRRKRIRFLGRTVDVCTQNENGPCPLLALANVLLLRNVIHIDSTIAGSEEEGWSCCSSRDVIATLATRIVDANVATSEKEKASMQVENEKPFEYHTNTETNVETALSVLPSLTNGLDVNVRFIDSEAFEYTANVCVFDTVDVRLYHGWVVDAKFDVATGHVISRRSYNQLVERLIELRELEREQEMIETEKKKIEEELNLSAKENVLLATEDSPTTGELNKQLDELAEMMEGGGNVTTTRSIGERGSSQNSGFSEMNKNNSNKTNSDSENKVAAVGEDEEGNEKEENEKARLQRELSNNFSKIVMERTAIEEFLETTSTQCTEEGLKSVFRNMRNNELGVFFRNNHFSVIFKRDNRYVLSLVTDEGFIDEPSIVWEIVYDNGAIDSDDIDHAEETNDDALARLMREQRARERDQFFLNADFKPFDGSGEGALDSEKGPPVAMKTEDGRAPISSSQPGAATSGGSLSSFSPRKGTSFPASPKKALGNPPTATTTSSSDDDFELARKLHSELNPDARFEAPSAPDTHHVDAQFIPPAQTYENSTDADLAYAMRLQREEEIAAAFRQDRERGGHRSTGRDSSPTSGRRGRLAQDPMYAVDDGRRGQDGNAYLRPVRKMKVSSSAKKSGPKTSENCCVQ